MRPILLSCRPVYADGLMDLTKTHEFRKALIPEGTTVALYRSGAPEQRGIVGLFVAGRSVTGTPDDLMAVVPGPGIDLVSLRMYAGGEGDIPVPRNIWAVAVTQVEKFVKAVPLRHIGLRVPPQSFRYLTAEQVTMLREIAAVPF